jgi:hypothetical protein
MAATDAQATKVRAMTAEKNSDTYSDAEIKVFIEAHPLPDLYGLDPTNDDWMATYDLNAAAADIWEEKAGKVASDFDFDADGGSYSRSQVYEQMMQQARHFRARRSLRTITAKPTYPYQEPEETNETV